MTMCFNVRYSEKMKVFDKSEVETIREYHAIILTKEKHFDADGNFTQDDLIRNDGKVFAVIVEKTDSDSENRHYNADFEVQEVFLTREKAVNLYSIIDLHNKLIAKLSGAYEKNRQKIVEDFIEVLKNSFGIDSHLEDVEKLLPYRDESDNIKTLKPNWHQFGTSEHEMFVLEKAVLNYMEDLENDNSHIKNVKFRYH